MLRGGGGNLVPTLQIITLPHLVSHRHTALAPSIVAAGVTSQSSLGHTGGAQKLDILSLTSLTVSTGVTWQARIIEDIIFPTEIIETSAIFDDRITFLRIVIIGIVVIQIGGEEEHQKH